MHSVLTPSRRATIRRAPVLASSIALLLFTGALAEAGNTWDGGGGDNNWGTGANWNPDGSPAPGSGNDLFFGGSTRLSPFNNYTAFDDWRNITFNAGAGSFNLFGNAIDLFGKIENLSANSQTVSLASIALNSATANEFNPVNGNLTILSTNVFTNGNQLKVFGNNGFTLSFGSGTTIQHGGSLSINQNSTVIFNSAHSYTGDTFVNAGKLQFASGGSANSSVIRIGDTAGTIGAEFDLTVATGGQSVGNTIVSRPGGIGYSTRLVDSQNTSGVNALTGVIALDAALTLKQAAGGTLNLTGSFADVKQQVLTVDAAGTVDVSKPLNSSFTAGGSLVKQGNGTLILSNVSNSYTGTNSATLNANGTQIAAGTLAIAADTSLGVAPSGAYNNVQFTGTGSLRSDATISLNANRNISIAPGATASLDSNGNTFTINGIVNGSTGAVTKIGAGTLVLAGSNTYTGVTTIKGGTLQVQSNVAVSTNGSLGNAASAVLLGDTTGSAGATLQGNKATLLTFARDITVQSGSSGAKTITNSGAGNFKIDSFFDVFTELSLDSASGLGNVELTGNLQGNNAGSSLRKTGTGTVILSGATNTTTTTNIVAGTLRIGTGSTTGTLGSGAVTNDGTLVINRSNAYSLGNNIGGSGGLRKEGGGTTTLTGTNTFSGLIDVRGGILSYGTVSNSGNGTLVDISNGADYRATGSLTSTKNVNLGSGGGTFSVDGAGLSVIHTGGVGTAGNAFTVNVLDASSSVAFTTTAISGGSGSLTKSGLGTATLDFANTYGGGTIVNGGELVVNNLTGTGSGSVTVNGGGALAPVNGLGTIDTGSLSLTGATSVFKLDLDLGVLDADLVNVTGGISLANSTLDLALLNAPISLLNARTFLVAQNNLSDAVNGIFGSILGLPTGYSVLVDYAFLGTDSLGRIGDGNDIALTVVPEAATAIWGVAVGLFAFGRRARARRQSVCAS